MDTYESEETMIGNHVITFPVPPFKLGPLEAQASPTHRTVVATRRSLPTKRFLVVGLAVLAAVSDGTMSFLDHLEELRTRLMISIAALLVGVLAAYTFVETIFDFMMRPLQETLPANSTFVFTEPAEFFVVRIKMAIVVGVFVASPVILWQLWLFVAPGLYAREKRYAIPFVVFSTLFFVAGGLFSHYIAFQLLWTFFSSYETDLVAFMPRIAPAFSLYMRMLLSFGVIFQMPTLAFFLARIGLITPRFLIRNFKYAVLIVFILAAALTPSPDGVNQLIMAGPMLALYGLSILIAWLFGTANTDQD